MSCEKQIPAEGKQENKRSHVEEEFNHLHNLISQMTFRFIFHTLGA